MNGKSRILVVVGTVIILLMVLSSTALAAEFKCSGSYQDTTFDSVLVPKGEICRLRNVTINGKVVVEEGAYFELQPFGGYAQVGDVKSNGGAVLLRDVHVEGDVQVKKSLYVVVNGSWVSGNIELEKNVDYLEIIFSDIEGNVELTKNSGSSLGIFLNDIGGSLICTENEPAVSEAENAVGGDKIGECAD